MGLEPVLQHQLGRIARHLFSLDVDHRQTLDLALGGEAVAHEAPALLGGASHRCGEHGFGLWRVAYHCVYAQKESCALRVLAVEEPETLGFAAVLLGFEKQRCDSNSRCKRSAWGTQYTAAPAIGWAIITLAYTGSSPLMQTS